MCPLFNLHVIRDFVPTAREAEWSPLVSIVMAKKIQPVVSIY